MNKTLSDVLANLMAGVDHTHHNITDGLPTMVLEQQPTNLRYAGYIAMVTYLVFKHCQHFTGMTLITM